MTRRSSNVTFSHVTHKVNQLFVENISNQSIINQLQSNNILWKKMQRLLIHQGSLDIYENIE